MSSLLIDSSDFHLYRLKYVLMMYLVRQVVWADDIVDPSEIQFVRDHFPSSVLAALDLLDTSTHQDLLEEALALLPSVLSKQAKAEIFAASAVDGQIDPREIAVVQVAAETLKMEPDELFTLIQDLLDDQSNSIHASMVVRAPLAIPNVGAGERAVTILDGDDS